MRTAVLAAIAIAASPGSAAAQEEPDKATAEALFQEARALVGAGHAEQACPKFEASQRLDPGLGTLLNLADCYERVGRTASAWATFREAEALAEKRGEHERGKLARERADALAPRLPRILIRVSEQARLPGLVVRRGEVAIDAAAFATAVPIDPGLYEIEASAPGRRPWQRAVRVGPGPTLVEVVIPVLAPAPVLKVRAPPGPEGPRRRVPSELRTGLVIGAGSLAVVGFAVGGLLGLKAKRRWDESRERCDGGACGDPEGVELGQDAARFADTATVSVAIGIAAAATAGVLWWTWPRAPAATPSIELQASGQATSVVVSGRF